jgi:hypothetical protein
MTFMKTRVFRYLTVLAGLLVLLLGCQANDGKDAQAAFEQIQAAAKSKDAERVWDRIDKHSQEFLIESWKKAAKGDANVDMKAVKANALEQLRSKVAEATFKEIHPRGNRAVVVVDKPAKDKEGPTDTVDMIKEDNVWKVALRTD